MCRQDNYVMYHCHTMYSNPTTVMDSVSKYEDYIDKAKESGMTAIAFTEHGNTFEWSAKKRLCEENGLKYIHGVEAYFTNTLDEKIRDNYHVVLLAKNHAGVLELNTLVSKSFNRAKVNIIDDKERFYHNPRIFFDELINTSDNIIVTTACLGGGLRENNPRLDEYIDFLCKNKHRCFLEIQHHNVEDQKAYNLYLKELSDKHGIRLIAGTDTHCLDEKAVEGRIVLQKAKDTYFENEEGWDLTFKTRKELENAYSIQGALNEKDYIEAIDNTNLIVDMVEEFEIDRLNKYPPFSDTPRKDVERILRQEIKESGAVLYEGEEERLKYELDTYEHNGALNLLLLEYDVKKYARSKNIMYGDSRGSVSGSQVAYRMKVTNSDSIRHGLNFERFMNTERVSLADIDTDWPPSDRPIIKDYLHSHKLYHTAEIITFNTIADKGSLKDVGRALEIPLDEMDMITKTLDAKRAEHEKKYPDLFRLADMLNGVIVSIGSHPAATICSPITLYDNIGTITLSTNDYPVSCLSMGEIDKMNFVKLDLLGLDTIGVIAMACDMAGIERLTSDNVDEDDLSVWEDIVKSPVGIFQFEGSFAHNTLKNAFRKETLNKMKKLVPDISYIDIMSMVNGAIRPAGASYRDALTDGKFHDNGCVVLNEFFKKTMGQLVFQEDIISFLHHFCGYTMGKADIVRRGFSKKAGTEQFIPEIKAGFIETMTGKYGLRADEAEKVIVDFLKVIEDASDYLFSNNHAKPYSYIGYICGYLRYYYPLEFLCSLLTIREKEQKKTGDIFDYIRDYTKIKIMPIRFGYSGEEYTIDKKQNAIYKGIGSIKYCNKIIAQELFRIGKNEYESFVDLLIEIDKNTSVTSRQLNILILLDYFKDFGNARELTTIAQWFDEFRNSNKSGPNYYRTQVSADAKHGDIVMGIVKRFSRLSGSGKTYLGIDAYAILNEIETYVMNSGTSDFTTLEKIKAQEEYLGYINFKTGKNDNRDKLLILNVRTIINKYGRDKGKPWRYIIDYMSLGSGFKKSMTLYPKIFENDHIKTGDIIHAKRQSKNDDGYWYLYQYEILGDDFVL